MKDRITALLAVVALSSCQCVPAPPPKKDAPVARVSAVLRDGGGFDIVLASLKRPVRSLQVDVKLDGALASSVEALGGSDVVEAGLDAPKDDFTIVVADTRHLSLPAGAVARIATGLGLRAVTLTGALAVDDSGALRNVTEVVP